MRLDNKETLQKPTKDDLKEFNEWVNKKKTSINRELFKKNFKFRRLSDMLKVL